MEQRYPLLSIATLLLSLPALAQRGVGPTNDLCDSAIFSQLDTTDLIIFTGDNTGATATGDFEQGSVPFSSGNAAVWHGFHLDVCADVTLALCGSSSAFVAHYWTFLTTSCPAGDAALVYATSIDTLLCGNDLPTLFFPALEPGDYYVPVLSNENLGVFGPYTLNVSALPCATGIGEYSTSAWSVRALPGFEQFELNYGGAGGVGHVIVLDAMGRMVLERGWTLQPGSVHLLPLAGFSPGIYRIQLIEKSGWSQRAIAVCD
ncbi:MAG: hypothetical protein ABI432_00920 [Flavobacteriales bacterium]